MILVLLCSVPSFGEQAGSFFGWKAEGRFTVNKFTVGERESSADVAYGEAFLLSIGTHSEYTLLFYLKNGGKIEIKIYKDSAFVDNSLSSAMSGPPFKLEFARNLVLSGYGIFKEFDKNSKLVKEKKYNLAEGLVSTYLESVGKTFDNMDYSFKGEAVYKLHSDTGMVEIYVTISSPY